MFELLQMWALVEVLGIGCLPLACAIFHNLPDRGWAFSKALGMLVLAFCVWLPLMCIPALPFSQLFILEIGLLLAAGSLLAWLRLGHIVAKMVRHNLIYVIATEMVFLGMVFLLGWVRSFGPDIRSFEMFMDEGFVASIMRSPHFPPNDMWFSGYSINYYYYAHYTIAVLAKFLGQSPSVAFNTGICIFFGLCAVNLFGLTSNVVAWARQLRSHSGAKKTTPIDTAHAWPALLPAVPYGILSCLMALIFGNLAATQRWWTSHDSPVFDLLGFWFGSTRVLSPQNATINEFPAFSFLLSCFHAHVLTLAFTILAMALAFNLFLEPAGKGLRVFGHGWRLPVTLVFTALVLGGLFIMNSWDYPTYMGITLVCIACQQYLVYAGRFSLNLLANILLPAGLLVGLSLICYLPFLLNFVSPSQGIGLVTPSLRSLLSEELLIYGLFAFVFLSFLLASAFMHPVSRHVEQTESESLAEVPKQSSLIFIILAFCVIYLIVCMVILRVIANSTTFVASSSLALLGAVLFFYHLHNRAHAFALLLGVVAFGLVATCEIVYLRDVFADGDNERMNTVFKFYFQAWVLLAVACGVGVFFILENFRPAQTTSLVLDWLQPCILGIWSLFFCVLVLASMIYPLNAVYARYAHSDATSPAPHLVQAPNLDGLTYLASCKPPSCEYDTSGDYKAIRWLNANVQGDPGIVEAIGAEYSSFGRISAFTGLSCPMGWSGHEYQWRVVWITKSLQNYTEFQRRALDVDQIYTSTDPLTVLSLMKNDHVQYLYIGALERTKYPQADLNRYSSFMQVVYNADGVTIYKVS
jgi:YYY domain-containing protein